MTPNEQVRPLARKADLVIQEVADEVLVYDLKSHQAHCLNQTAALVWKYCDGQKTVADITALLGKETTIDEPAVWLAVQRLGKAQLLEERVLPPAGSPRFGRREAIRRLGIGSAIAVPIVMSIVAPTALAGCTINGGTPGLPCCTNGNCQFNCCSFTGTCINPGASPTGTPCNTASACQCSNGCCSGNPGTCLQTGLGKNSQCTLNCQCASGVCAGPGNSTKCD